MVDGTISVADIDGGGHHQPVTRTYWYNEEVDDGLFNPSSLDALRLLFARPSNRSTMCFHGGSSMDGVTSETPFDVDCRNGTWLYGDDSSEFEKDSDLVGHNDNYWALMLLVFPVLTVFGNVLVVLSVYRERSLQSVTNYFIVSLAVADIMVAILVMPLAVYVEVS